jgi:hypothetical protein
MAPYLEAHCTRVEEVNLQVEKKEKDGCKLEAQFEGSSCFT